MTTNTQVLPHRALTGAERTRRWRERKKLREHFEVSEEMREEFGAEASDELINWAVQDTLNKRTRAAAQPGDFNIRGFLLDLVTDPRIPGMEGAPNYYVRLQAVDMLRRLYPDATRDGGTGCSRCAARDARLQALNS